MTTEFIDKRIIVVGMGLSGKAAFDVLLALDCCPAVFDDRDIEADDPELFAKLSETGAKCFFGGAEFPAGPWDYVVLSPGVPPELPFIVGAEKRGAIVIGELELAWMLGKGIFVAITGTNGKTTTTMLVGEIFKDAGLKASVCGNIGRPVAREALAAYSDTWLITEVSSFQLDTIIGFRPRIAAILNLTPDHLDRHRTMGNYAASKARIFENQLAEDILVFNADDEIVTAMAAGAVSTKIPFSRLHDTPLVPADELQIPGAHNLENALAAAAIALAAGIDPASIAETLRNFRGVEHRLEFVAEVNGVRFINDSKGTNPDASIKAIEAVWSAKSVNEHCHILLISGGYDKEADFTEFARACYGRVQKLILLGETAGKIRDCAIAAGFDKNDTVLTGGMEETVCKAFALAEPGDTILLSPACASWDMYKDYEERGAHFKALVAELATEPTGPEVQK